MNELSGVFERVVPESFQVLQEVVGGCPVLADLAGPGADDIGIVFGEDCREEHREFEKQRLKSRKDLCHVRSKQMF